MLGSDGNSCIKTVSRFLSSAELNSSHHTEVGNETASDRLLLSLSRQVDDALGDSAIGSDANDCPVSVCTLFPSSATCRDAIGRIIR
jgi:hypothetical protein